MVTTPSPLAAVRRAPRLPRRLAQLLVGLVAYGVSMALLVRSQLGVMPWDVLHQGLARRFGADLGVMTMVVGALVLLAWIPLRERPGVGTVANVLVVGLAVDATLAVLPDAAGWPSRVAFALGGIGLNGAATAAYVGVHLGPGPRDGLMTGLVRRTGGSVRVVRTAIEVGVVAVGWLLGGTLGPATVLYALAVGPLVQLLLRPLGVVLPGRTVPGFRSSSTAAGRTESDPLGSSRPTASSAGPGGTPVLTRWRRGWVRRVSVFGRGRRRGVG